MLAVLAFTAIGGYDRLEALGSASLWNDEAQSTLYAFSILQHGYPIIVSPHLINNWEPAYPYLEAASIRLLGFSNFASRLPAALIGIALIPVSYLTGARLRSRYVGITAAGLMAFSTEYIAWSRTARWYVLLVLVMALGFLAAHVWYRSHSRRERFLCVGGMVGLGLLGGLTSIGLFLLYLPGILAAILVYLLASHFESIRGYFGRPLTPVTANDTTHPRFNPARGRLWILLGGIAATGAVAVLELGRLEAAFPSVFERVVGFPPYPAVWSSNLGLYLIEFYPGIIALAVLAAAFMLLRRDPFDLALLALCGVSFVSLSVGASVTNNIAGGLASFTRHLLPLLFFLFLLAAVALVEAAQRLYRTLPLRSTIPAAVRGTSPVILAVAIVALLVVPCIAVPSNLVLYTHPSASPADTTVPWVAFSLDPAYPSALYAGFQPNYQLPSEYVVAHRNATDIVAATTPGPPTVYIGDVRYWITGNPIPTTVIHRDGVPEFYQTGSVLLANTSQLESLVFTNSGWLISDEPASAIHFFPRDMGLVLEDFMTKISAGSDVSITLYHWNQSTPGTLIEMLQARTPSLGSLGANLTSIANWMATGGVTWSSFRDLLLPMEPALIGYVSPAVLPLAVLVDVYNHRPDLQAAFPQLLLTHPPNYTGLIQWAYRVASGATPDPAQSVLAPYVTWYRHHG